MRGDILSAEKQRHKKRVWARNPRLGVNIMLAVYSVGHLAVDMCCCAAMLAFTRGGYFAYAMLTYVVCAFVLPLPIGAAADHFGRTGGLSIFGCVMIGAAMVATPAPFVLAVMLGVGNACYHVGGGVFALRSCEGCGSLGAFFAPGTFGLFIGMCASDALELAGPAIMVLTVLLMIITVFLIVLAEPVSDPFESVAPFPHGIAVNYPAHDFLGFVCFFVIAAMRSFCGGAFNFAWRADIDALAADALLACAAVLGMMLGGVLADNIGMKAASSGTLLISSALMLLSDKIIFAVVAVLAFNMAAPLLMRAASDIYNRREGLTLGILTFGYFLGLLPLYFDIPLPFGAYGNAASSVLVLAIMAAGLELSRSRT